MSFGFQKIWKQQKLQYFFSIEDHRGFLIDVLEELILRNKITKIQKPYVQRLIFQKKEVKKYIKELEKQIKHHTPIEKMKYIKDNKTILSQKML